MNSQATNPTTGNEKREREREKGMVLEAERPARLSVDHPSFPVTELIPGTLIKQRKARLPSHLIHRGGLLTADYSPAGSFFSSPDRSYASPSRAFNEIRAETSDSLLLSTVNVCASIFCGYLSFRLSVCRDSELWYRSNGSFLGDCRPSFQRTCHLEEFER